MTVGKTELNQTETKRNETKRNKTKLNFVLGQIWEFRCFLTLKWD